MSSKLPDPLGGLPDPATAAAARRSPFSRPAHPPDVSSGPAADATTADPDTAAPTGTGKSAGKPKKSAQGSGRTKRMAGSVDVLLSLPADLKGRLESVLAYTYPHTGVNQQAAFIRAAIAKSCADLEARYNDGNRWPEIPKPKSN